MELIYGIVPITDVRLCLNARSVIVFQFTESAMAKETVPMGKMREDVRNYLVQASSNVDGIMYVFTQII